MPSFSPASFLHPRRPWRSIPKPTVQPGRIRRARPTASSSIPGSGSTTRRPSPTISPISASATSTARPTSQAAPGSTHGYDVIDHGRVNEELGGAEGHARLCRTLARHGPRPGARRRAQPHGASPTAATRWWWDVLENGPSSRYALYFDVDWDPPEAKLRNTVLLPILGDHYGRVLEAGELTLRARRRGVRGHVPRPRVAGRSAVARRAARPRPPRARLGLAGVHRRRARPLAALDGHRPGERPAPPSRQGGPAAATSPGCCEEEPEVAAAVDADRRGVNATPDALDALLERQNYRLAFWRTAGRELDYRRFFDINTLVGLRIEDERVFADTHALILRWLARRRARRRAHRSPRRPARSRRSTSTGCATRAPTAWIVVEKILEPGERLRELVARRRHHRLRLPEPRGRPVHRPGQARRPLTELYAELHRREPADFAGRRATRRSTWSCATCSAATSTG